MTKSVFSKSSKISDSTLRKAASPFTLKKSAMGIPIPCSITTSISTKSGSSPLATVDFPAPINPSNTLAMNQSLQIIEKAWVASIDSF